MWPILLLSPPAFARSTAWFREGAAEVLVTAGQIDVPLYRGPTTRYLPTIEVQVEVEGEQRPSLAVIDIAGGWCRISSETANSLGIPFAWEKFQGEWHRVATLSSVSLRDLTFVDLRVEITDDAPGFVLGLGALPEVAAALLPSEGVVRWVPAKYGTSLVASIGTAIPASRQPPKVWKTEQGRVRGDGLTLRVPGSLRWGAALVDGTFHLRTDLETSRVSPSDRLPEPVMRAGEPFHDVGAKLGEIELPDTWIREEPKLSDPAPDFAAALGYDVLFGVDIAVAPSAGVVAFRKASKVQWTNATPISVEFARKRYEQEEDRAKGTSDATGAPADEKPTIGFQGPNKQELVLGDPGKPKVRDRNLVLAETLWWAGDLDEAIPYYLAASQHAGDHCASHLRLGERRLAWAGAKLLDGVVGKLVVDPLDRAGKLWDAWQSLDDQTREVITEGKDIPEGTLQVWQPPECRVAYGLLSAVERARGKLESIQKFEEQHLPKHPSIAYTRGLVALSEQRFGGADPLLSVAAAVEAVDPVDLQVAVARAKGGKSQLDPLLAIAKEIPGYPTDHPLTVALGMLEAGRLSGRPDQVTRKLLRSDERWIPGVLANALATGQPPPPWDPTIEQRWPGSPQVACQKAVHLALMGQVSEAIYLLRLERWPGFADWWAAIAVVSHLSGDHQTRDDALRELMLRYPLLPTVTLGLE
jgi:hypothetical protein